MSFSVDRGDEEILSEALQEAEELLYPCRRIRRQSRRRLLRLSDVSECLRNDPAVVAAFCRLDAVNFALAPEKLQSKRPRRSCRLSGKPGRHFDGASVSHQLRIGILPAVRYTVRGIRRCDAFD